MSNAYNSQYADNMTLNLNSNVNINHYMLNSSSKIDINNNNRNHKKQEKKRKSIQIISFESFDIYRLGKVKDAILHSLANKPLKQIKQPDSSLEVCPCCNSYYAKKGYFGPYSICENPDEFSNCGQGVVLYFSFLKYIIAVTFIASLCTSFVNIYYSNNYYIELREVCNNIYKNQIKLNKSFVDYYKSCNYYYANDDDNYFEHNLIINDFFFRFSSVNIKDYRILFDKINTNKNETFESTIINISRINFATLIFLFFFNLVFILYLFNKSNAADYLVFTVSDYSVIFYNLYDVHGKFLNIKKEIEEKKQECMRTGKQYIPDLYEKRKLGFRVDEINSEIDQFKEFIKNKVCQGTFNERFKINRIDLSYKIGELKKLQDKLEKKKEKISKIENFPEIEKKNKDLKLEGDNRKYFGGFLDYGDSDDDQPLLIIKKKKRNIERQINVIIEKSKKDTINFFGGTAFVTFDTIREQELYMKNVPNNIFAYLIQYIRNISYIFCSCCVNKSTENIYYLKRNIKFEDAPEPQDIKFENLEVSFLFRTIRTIGIYFISIIICGISFIIILALNKLQDNDKKKYNDHIVFLYLISLAITVVTSFIDKILQVVFETFTGWEKHITITKFYLSYSVKLTIFTFLNSAILPLISEIFFNKSEGYEILISNMLMKFLVNAFLTPIMWTLSIGYYFKKIQQCLYEKNLLGSRTQKELNNLYELPPMYVSAKYSYISKTLLMSFLYIPIFPLGVIISFLGFSLTYLLEKINFAYYYKKPEMLNKQLCEFYVRYFVVVLFAYGVGDYIFLSDAYDTRVWSLVNIIIFGILIVIPYHRVLSQDFIKFKESDIYNKKYNDVYLDFNIDYERANPMTKQVGEIRFETARREKGIITNEEYERNINSLKNCNFMDSYFNRRYNYYGKRFMGRNFFQEGSYNKYNQNCGFNENNINGNNTIDPNYQNEYNNMYNNQVNYAQINNQNIFNSKVLDSQQINQPMNYNQIFNLINNNYNPYP